MAKVKNVVPYVVGIGALAAGAYLVKKRISATPEQVTIIIPEGEYNPTQQSVKNQSLIKI